jgi:multidrug efflux pump subunit AcrB
MALHHTSTSVAISIACLAVVAVLSAPAAGQLFTRIRARKKQYAQLSKRYEDKDGVATEESEQAYSDVIPRLILILISIVACGVALTTAILTTTRSHLPLSLEQWLQFATWVRTATQSFVTGHVV